MGLFLGFCPPYHCALEIYTSCIFEALVSHINTPHRYKGCHRRNGPNFGRVFLMLNYTDITQNTYVPS